MQHPRYGGDSVWKVQREKEVHGEGVTEPSLGDSPPDQGKARVLRYECILLDL